MSKQRIFIDMDGVLAVWDKEATIEEVVAKGYFRGRPSEFNIVEAVKCLISQGKYEICILSAVFNDNHSRQEKTEWLKAMGINPDQIIFSVYGEPKSDALSELRADDVLIDDFTSNLKTWHGIGIKFLNGINSTKNTWHGYTISRLTSPEKLARAIDALAQTA